MWTGSLFYEVRLTETDIYLAGLDPATGKLTNRAPIGSLVEHTLSTGEERQIWGRKSGSRATATTVHRLRRSI